MATIVPPPILDTGLQRALMGFAQPFAQGMAVGGQRKMFGQDIQDIENYRRNMQIAEQAKAMGTFGQGPEWPGSQPTLPIMQSQMGRQAQMQSQLGQMFPAPPDPFTLAPGAGRFTGAGQLVAEREPALMQPTQKAAQAKLDAYNKAKAVPIRERTKHQQAVVEKYELGQALVQINLGRASPTERTSIAETRASIDALNNIKQLYDSAKTRTGPVVGRLDPVLGLFGLTGQEQEDFMAATSAFRNKIIEEITGAQMSEIEAKRILKQVPQETDPPMRWEAKWRQSKKNLEMLQKRRLEILRQSGLQAPMGQTINIEDMTDEELKRIAGEQ